jgi:hypothetical protein
MIIETYMNNLNQECGIAEDLDFDNFDSNTRLFVNDKNQIYFGMIVNYFGDIQVVNLITGEFGFFDPENNQLKKEGKMKVTYFMKDLNRYLLQEYDYDNIIEHI